MATPLTCGAKQLTATRRASPSTARRATITVRASQKPSLSRREATAAAGAFVVGITSVPAPALAFLGLGEDGNERYTAETTKLIADITSALELPVGDAGREEAFKAVRKSTVDWVSKYRRDPKFSGRPSYSNLYSAINALDGQLNSFGLTAKIPAKRLERLQKEISDADKQLQRGR